MTFRSRLTPDCKFKKGRNLYQFKLFITNYILYLVSNLFRGNKNNESFLKKKEKKKSSAYVTLLLTPFMLITFTYLLLFRRIKSKIPSKISKEIPDDNQTQNFKIETGNELYLEI